MRGGGQASLGQVSFTKTISMGTHYFDYYVDDGSMCHALPDTDTQVNFPFLYTAGKSHPKM